MPQYLYETHLHTAEVSGCARAKAAEGVRLYAEAGYDGIVVTDHFIPEVMYREGVSWEQALHDFLSGYRAAKEAGERLPAGKRLTVLWGIELRFFSHGNDYLVYGVTEQFLLDNPDILKMGMQMFMPLARKNGLLIYQAHPFRNGMQIVSPALIDGIETYNGNLRHDSRNEFAAEWAKRYSRLALSGSDFHEPGDEARGGIYTTEPVTDNASLLAALRGDIVLKVT